MPKKRAFSFNGIFEKNIRGMRLPGFSPTDFKIAISAVGATAINSFSHILQ